MVARGENDSSTQLPSYYPGATRRCEGMEDGKEGGGSLINTKDVL